MAWSALVLVIVLIVLTAIMRGDWWMYIDVFCAFIMTFMHLTAVYMRRMPAISRQLDITALIFGIFAIIAFLCEAFILE